MPDGGSQLTKKVTFDFGDGDMVTTVEIEDGAIGGGWGIIHVDITSTTPIRPGFIEPFMEAAGKMLAYGPIAELIALHDAEG